MSKPELASFVYVTDEGGDPVAFGPGDTVPAWAAEQITNPKAWKVAWSVEPAVVDVELSPVAVTDPSTAAGAPPTHGRGSSREAWLEYADDLGVPVPADATRDEIVALVGEGDV